MKQGTRKVVKFQNYEKVLDEGRKEYAELLFDNFLRKIDLALNILRKDNDQGSTDK